MLQQYNIDLVEMSAWDKDETAGLTLVLLQEVRLRLQRVYWEHSMCVIIKLMSALVGTVAPKLGTLDEIFWHNILSDPLPDSPVKVILFKTKLQSHEVESHNFSPKVEQIPGLRQGLLEL